MKRTEPGWELYRSFLAVLREGSLSAAARGLGLTQPTVGRHVDELESALNVALFTRSPGGLKPTRIAGTLEPHARAMEGAAAALTRAAAAGTTDSHAVVRIAASEIIGAEALPPILAALRARHPAIVVELSLSDRAEDVLRREADIAVRMTRPRQGALLARRIGAVTVGLHAHRRYLDAHGRPDTTAQLAQHALIGFDRETTAILALRRLGLKLTREDFAFRSDSHVAQLAAIRAGFGIGICQAPIARSSGLVRVLAADFAFELEIWLAMHERLRADRAMSAVFDHLVHALALYARDKSR